MSKKYARGKTQYFKIISNGFAVGALGEVYNACMKHDQSCDVFGIIKEKSKFDDSYYKIYKDLSKNNVQQSGIDFFNLKMLLNVDDYNYKDKLLSCFTCGITSLFSAISYENLSKNILALSFAGGIINAGMKNIITGHSHTSDFIFGVIASIIGVHINMKTKEIELEDDILHPEIF